MKSRYISIFVISCVMLILELTFTRILSFIYWNHLVYLIISIVLLGYGIGSMFIILFRAKLSRMDIRHVQGYILLLFSMSVPLTMIVVSRAVIPISGNRLNLFGIAFPLLLNYLFFIIPFLFLGAFIVYYFFDSPGQSGLLYLFDLAGAAAGCVLFPFLFKRFGAPHLAMLMAGAGWAVGCALLFGASPRPGIRGKSLAAAIMLLFLFVRHYQGILLDFRPISTKVLARTFSTPGAAIEYTRWDPVARVDVAGAPKSSAITGRDFPLTDLPLKVLTNDGDAYTVIIDKNAYSLDTPCEQTFRFLQSTPYLLYPPKNVLIIGTGGGPDIIKALACRSGRITGVEVTGATVEAMQGPFADYSGGIYLKPNVKVLHDEGRSFLRRSTDKYNIIQMSGVDTFSALAGGAYVLAENYLYTVNAMKDYVNHLDEDGFLIIRRWYFPEHPRESLRLFVLAYHALAEMGVSDPGLHIVVAGKFLYANTIVKKSPLTGAEIQAFEAEDSLVPELETVFSPLNDYCANKGKNYFYAYACSYKTGDEKNFINNYFFDISPVYDNNPFFFKYYKMKNMFDLQNWPGGGRSGYWAQWIFLLILGQAAALILVFIILPLVVFKREGLALSGSFYLIVYFACLGLGFIIIEIALMQQLTLFLGLPVYSIAVVLSGLLCSAGLGSFASGRVKLAPERLLAVITLALALLIIITNLSLQSLMHYFLGAAFPARVALAVAVVFPLGFVLGFYFPVGLVISSEAGESFVPWAWGINSGFTVIGSILAIMAAMMTGFRNVLWSAIAIYLIAFLCMSVIIKYYRPRQAAKVE